MINDAGHAFRQIGIVDYQPTTDVEEDVDGVPRMLSLSVPMPNPVTNKTAIAYAVPRTDQVTLAIYDVAGRKVRTLFTGLADAGSIAPNGIGGMTRINRWLRGSTTSGSRPRQKRHPSVWLSSADTERIC
ncbi:MAG: hypothetical protein R3E12_18645 [Candidatus Eisenbacteria bacterium]